MIVESAERYCELALLDNSTEATSNGASQEKLLKDSSF